MDFARKLMENYGWKDGNGLGKNMDGIVKPLRANLKFDNAGFGADQAASDFNNHWWERVFNEATSNVAITVKDKDDGVCMGLKNRDETVDITTKGYSVNKLKKRKDRKGDQKYENFLQSSLLTEKGNEVENSKGIKIDDIEVKKFKQLTDEELFKACGGRTAHKGARHGLKLSGKLARLEMQEQEMLASILAKKKVAVVETISGKTENSVEKNEFALEVKRKSKKRTKICRESNVTSDENKSDKRKKIKENESMKDQLRGEEETKDTFRIEEESIPSVQHTKTRKNKMANKKNIIHRNAEIAEDTEYGDKIVREYAKNTTGIKNKKCKKNKKDREKMVVDAQYQETQETVENHPSARQDRNLGDDGYDKSGGSKNNARKEREKKT